MTDINKRVNAQSILSYSNPANDSDEEQIPIKYKQNVFLGSLLPGQTTSIPYSIEELTNNVQFLSVNLLNASVNEGFSLSKNKASEQKANLNLVLKAKSSQKFLIHIFAQNTSKSGDIIGKLKITVGKEVYNVNLNVKVQVPRIFCPKFLQSQKQGLNMLRITINKLATNEGRINMINMQKYPMQFQIEVVGKHFVDKDCPYNISSTSEVITAAGEKPFMFSVSISTNIFFKGSMNNMKKVVLRKLLLLKTNSSIIYTIPLEVIVVFVKQPQIKE